MVLLIEATLIRAQQAGEIKNKINPKEMAEFILFSWEGALLAMKASKEIKTLNNFDRMIFGQLLK